MTRAFGLFSIIALAATAGTVSTVGAATPVQRCNGPSTTDPAGSVAFSPGLNGHATKQKITVKIHLTSCAPPKPTGGAGTLKSTFTPLATETCVLYNTAHVLNATATITWKSLATSVLKLKFSLTGATRLMNVTGTVSSGTFAGHAVTGQYRYKPVSAHPNTTVAQSCANNVAPGTSGRTSIASLALTRTKPFIIT